MAKVSAMSEKGKMKEKMDTTCLFIDGYLTQLFESGHQPTYGYPTNHIPKTDGTEMEIQTGFLASPSSK
jgi:hypothetical protein